MTVAIPAAALFWLSPVHLNYFTVLISPPSQPLIQIRPREGKYSSRCAGFDAVNLAAGQATVRAIFVIIMASPEVFQAIHSSSSLLDLLQHLWPNWDSPRAVGLLVWLAFAPGSLAFILQMYGQKTVSASSAEVCLVDHLVLCVPISHTCSSGLERK